jgi:septal ring factor EnvC (AmiA/AmiB activator)
MTNLHRRSALLLMAGCAAASFQAVGHTEELSLPEVKRSEAQAIIKEFVNKLSKEKQKFSGVEMSLADKNKMEHKILSQIEEAGIYKFYDP